MKKRILTCVAIGLAAILAFPIHTFAAGNTEPAQVAALEDTGSITTVSVAQTDANHISVSGTCADTVVAVAIQIRNSADQIVTMESREAGNGQYQASIEITLSAGTYTAYVADYAGGTWAKAVFSITQSGGSSGGTTTPPSDTTGNTTTETKPETTTETKPDGTKVETKTDTKADGTKVDTTVETKTDGTKTETVVETAKDGSVKTTETVMKADGSATKTEKETETNTKGNKVAITVTTEKDAKGKVTGITQTSEIEKISGSASATVTVEKAADGKTISAEAEVDKKGANSKKGVGATLSGSIIAQIEEAANTKSVNISMTVTAGEKEYTVKADTKDLKAGNKLKVMSIDEKTGNYVLVNAKTYTVNKSGSVKVVLPEGMTYQLMDTKEAAAVEKKILSTVKAKKTAVTVEKGKKTAIQLSKKLDMDNVEKINYSTNKKDVVTVNKNGTVTAKKSGKVTVQAEVLLKNGKTKNVKMTVTVKP